MAKLASIIAILRGVDNFFEVGGLSRVTRHASRGVWDMLPPGNFWLFRALRLLLVQSHWWKAIVSSLSMMSFS